MKLNNASQENGIRFEQYAKLFKNITGRSFCVTL